MGKNVPVVCQPDIGSNLTVRLTVQKVMAATEEDHL